MQTPRTKRIVMRLYGITASLRDSNEWERKFQERNKMRSFASNPDNAPEKQEAYKAKLAIMTDTELYEECGSKIWFSAYANNNPISCYHWQCDACYEESKKRDDKTIYSRAHRAQVASCL